MARDFRIRCPVHGFVRLNREEVLLLNSHVLQRLRGVRQLAFANLVYPGAVHTRFEHSIGACHLAKEIPEDIVPDEDIRKLLSYTALLHDIGHAPFSHVGEEALKIFSDPGLVATKISGKADIHELIGSEIIKFTDEVSELIGKPICSDISKLITNWDGDPYIKSIISGPLDVDKQDYLLRDSYFCGVKYGIFDQHQFRRELRKISTKSENSSGHLGISQDGVHALEQFILAKFYLTQQVYTHKVRLITDQMLLRGIVLGIKADGMDKFSELFSYKDSEAYYKNYLCWDDQQVFYHILNDVKNSYCKKLFSLLKNRKLYKRIFREKLSQLSGSANLLQVRTISKPENIESRNILENAIYSELDKLLTFDEFPSEFRESRFVIVHVYQLKDLTSQAVDGEGQILVLNGGASNPSLFDQESQIFQTMQKGFEEGFIAVYAPLNYTESNKKAILGKVQEPIMESIRSFST